MSSISRSFFVYFLPLEKKMRGNNLFKFIDRYAGIPLLFAASLFSRKRSDLADLRPKRILVVKFSALGDAILLVPALRSLRRKYPDAEITLVGTNFTIPFLCTFPEYIGEFISLDLGLILRRPMYLISIVKQLRSLEFDLALDFEQWLRLSALLVRFSGAPHRLGFRTARQHRHWGFTCAVNRSAARHEMWNFLSLTMPATRTADEASLEARINEGGLVTAQSFLMTHGWQKGTPLLIVHPGCGSHGFPREWPPKKYGELIDRMAKHRPAFFVVTGTEDELPAMEAVRRSTQAALSLYAISTLADFTALLSMAALFISSNNGAMHLAAALGIPQVALHGPTNSVQWGPLNSRAVTIASNCPSCPCLDLGFEYHRTDGYCMEQIDVEDVDNAVNHFIV